MHGLIRALGLFLLQHSWQIIVGAIAEGWALGVLATAYGIQGLGLLWHGPLEGAETGAFMGT